MEAPQGGYKDKSNIELFTSSPERIVTMHSKTFVKIEDLAYFWKIQKHNKLWDYGTS